jgi:hypothetical protein
MVLLMTPTDLAAAAPLGAMLPPATPNRATTPDHLFDWKARLRDRPLNIPGVRYLIRYD